MRARLIKKAPTRSDQRDSQLGRRCGEIQPTERENAWAVEKGLAGRFVVMHSGNVGHAQDLDNLVRATTLLRDLDDLVVPIVGFGARHTEVMEFSERLEADKVLFLPYQPREVLPQSLAVHTSTMSGSPKGLPASWYRAACMGSSPRGAR